MTGLVDPAILFFTFGLPTGPTLSALAGLGVGDAALWMVLAASASYIAVPAVVRQAIPEARPALHLGLSSGLTFPFNILFGIGLHHGLAQRWLA